MRLVVPILVSLLAGCAHRAEPKADPLESQLVRLRQQDATLRRRVQVLEDRMLHIERTEAARYETLPNGRQLPVVKLEAPESSRPAPAPRPRGVPLEPVRPSPKSLTPQAVSGAAGAVPHGGPSLREQPDIQDGHRSFRLEGSRLVDLTKSKAPKRPDRPARGRRGSAILLEYETAMQTYRGGHFSDAQAAFARFAAAHPRHDYADNAIYWEGEAAYDQGHFSDALAAFTNVVERYGGGNKAPDALLKIGLCYGKLGDLANARDVLTQLIAAYPGERASNIARVKLAELQES